VFLLQSDKNRTGTFLNMPSSCSYDGFAGTGKCAIKFTALPQLLQINVTIKAYATFSEASGVDELEIICVGDACGAIASPKECSKVRISYLALQIQERSKKTAQWLADDGSNNLERRMPGRHVVHRYPQRHPDQRYRSW
jgi:hypothetical protein